MRRSLSEPMPASMYSQTTHRTLRCCRQQRRHSTVNGAHYSAAWPHPLRRTRGLGFEEGCQAFDGGGGFGQPEEINTGQTRISCRQDSKATLTAGVVAASRMRAASS